MSFKYMALELVMNMIQRQILGYKKNKNIYAFIYILCQKLKDKR